MEDLTLYYLNSEGTDSNEELRHFRDIYQIEYVPSLIYFFDNSYDQIMIDSQNKTIDKIKINKYRENLKFNNE